METDFLNGDGFDVFIVSVHRQQVWDVPGMGQPIGRSSGRNTVVGERR